MTSDVVGLSTGASHLQAHQSRKPRVAVLFVYGLAILLVAIPTASAWSIPLVGNVEPGLNLTFILFCAGIAGIIAATALGAALFKKIPIAGPVAGAVGMTWGIVLLLVVAWMAPGGFLHSDNDSPATIVGSAAAISAPGAAGFDALRYEPVSKVTWSVADASTNDGAGISATIKVYRAGVTEKAAMEGTAKPVHTKTLTDGAGVSDGIQVQTLGCSVDVLVDYTGYYQKLFKGINICREKNTQGLNAVYPETFYIDDFGTFSGTLVITSVTCAAGSQCSYELVLRNSEGDSVLHRYAAKFESLANATLDSADGGQSCQLVERSGSKYVEFTTSLTTGTDSCNLKVTRAAGSADGSFRFVVDDNLDYLGATGWNTHTNVRGAAALTTNTVSFA